MGTFQVEIARDIAVAWPVLVERAGCAIQSVKLDSSRTSAEVPITDLDKLTHGLSDYWATVICENSQVDMAFLKSVPQASDEDCFILPRGIHENSSFLKNSLLYMMISSGGRLSPRMKSLFRNTFLFYLAPKSVRQFLEAAQARNINVEVTWASDGLYNSSDTAKGQAMNPFCKMQLCRSQTGLSGWFGPAVDSTGTFGSFVVIHFKRSWWRRSQQNALLDEVLKLLSSIDAKEIKGYIQSV